MVQQTKKNRTVNRRPRSNQPKRGNQPKKKERERVLVPKQLDTTLVPDIKLKITGFWPFRFVDCDKEATLDEATGKMVKECDHETITPGPLDTREECAQEIIRQFVWRCTTILGLAEAPKCTVRKGGPKKDVILGVICPMTKSEDGKKSLAEAKFGIDPQRQFANSADCAKYFEARAEKTAAKKASKHSADELFAGIE